MHFAKFDLDSTLIDTEALIFLALAEQGYMIDEGAHDSYNFKFLDGCAPPPDFQWDVFFYRMLTERVDELKPVDEYVERFLELVYDGQCPIHIITARAPGVLMHHACMDTLGRCFPDVEFTVSIVRSGSDKVKYMDCADIFFDDRRKTAIELVKHGNICVMPNKSYNKIPDHSGLSVTEIEDLDLMYLGPGDIIRYDDFKQVIESGLCGLIAPF